MAEELITYSQGDQVVLLGTRGVDYISHPPDEEITPRGVWLVAAGVGDRLLLTKGSATIRIPAADVRMYMKCESFNEQLRSMLDVPEQSRQVRRRQDGEV